MIESVDSNAVVRKTTYFSLPSIRPWMAVLALLLLMWFLPAPEGISLQAWHLFAIFVTTILGIIFNILPMGALAIMALAFSTITHTLTTQQALSGFSSHIMWLILTAFFLARGFIKTGLGARIAYNFVKHLGKRPLGLAYGLITTEFLLAPFTPSNTARGAGILYPIVSSLAKEYGSTKAEGTHKKIGAYLMQVAYQANVITSAMFLTSAAGNPLIASLASKIGVELNWTSWALAALVPGVISLAVLPALLYIFYPPELKETPKAPEFARQKLQDMGPLSKNEWIMLSTFGLLLALWMFGSVLNVDATVAAFLGVSILLASKVLTWEDLSQEYNGWHTFVWLTTLLTLSNFLTEFGMISWLSTHMQGMVSAYSWLTALVAIALFYFYIHYAFASMTAHISAMFSPFAMVAIASGAPPMMTVLTLSFFSSLCASLTHYGTGSAPVYFGAEYVTLKAWWKLGAITSISNILIWAFAGALWWKILGLW